MKMSAPKSFVGVKANPRNPRKAWGGAKRGKFVESLRRFGDLGGIVANVRTKLIVGGHKRVEEFGGWDKLIGAAQLKQLAQRTKSGTVAYGVALLDGEPWAVRLVDWSATEEKDNAAMLAANQWGAEWDETLLAEVLKEIDEPDQLITGFDESEIDRLLDKPKKDKPAVQPRIKEAEKLQEKWKVKRGQLWTLGDHKLLCGDALAPESWKRLGGPFGFCFADPPFDFNFCVENLRVATRDQLLVLHCDKWFIGQQAEGFRNFFCYTYDYAAGIPFSYCPLKQHNLIGYWRFAKGQFSMVGLGTTIHIGNAHDTTGGIFESKPISLVTEFIRFLTDEGETIADAFSGSGSMLIAAHRLKRRAASVELLPQNCALILQRFRDETGIEPTLQKNS